MLATFNDNRHFPADPGEISSTRLRHHHHVPRANIVLEHRPIMHEQKASAMAIDLSSDALQGYIWHRAGALGASRQHFALARSLQRTGERLIDRHTSDPCLLGD